MTQARPARFVAPAQPDNAIRSGVDAICAEALTQLAGFRLPDRTITALGRMVPSRQLAASRVMAAGNNCSGDFARALLAATDASGRADDPRGRMSNPRHVIQLAAMEQTLIDLQDKARSLSPGFYRNLSWLALSTSLIRNWVQDPVVWAWLQSRYPDSAATLMRHATASETILVPKRRMKLPYTVSSATESPADPRMKSTGPRVRKTG